MTSKERYPGDRCFKFCKHLTDSVKRETNVHAFKLLVLDHFVSLHSDLVHYYTEGSKTDDGVGCAVVFHNIQHQLKMNKNTSIFTAKLRAICDTLKLINDNPNCNFTVLTDSRSALQAIEINNSDHAISSNIRDWLIQLQSHHKTIHLCWVSSHIDIAGNERADQEARAPITNGVFTSGAILDRD